MQISEDIGTPMSRMILFGAWNSIGRTFTIQNDQFIIHQAWRSMTTTSTAPKIKRRIQFLSPSYHNLKTDEHNQIELTPTPTTVVRHTPPYFIGTSTCGG